MNANDYISINKIIHFHQIEPQVVQEFAVSEIIEVVEVEQEICIHCDHLDSLERALRLHDLGINPPGIEIILRMRNQIMDLQEELQRLR